MNTTELERLEAIIDTSGVSTQIEQALPVGVRRRQLSVRTLLLGMALTATACRPAPLRRIHQALLALPEPQQQRLASAPTGRPAATSSPTVKSSAPSR
jgi:hypothetical protein